ncbi:MAG: helix-turn-helix transcriptional regulator [Clostridia bacterium]|nr:helix-turn-helix transcriptional regulator [Clostridia bacterium]
MSSITNILGQRIRNYRVAKGFSQERLAEISGCHPTYIGQIERGEKNATIESITKISMALDVSLSTLFDKLTNDGTDKESIPLLCYELLSRKSREEQEKLYQILLQIEKYKSNQK